MGFDWKRDEILILDGAMGTMLQKHGLQPGGISELLNLTNPELIGKIHRDYVEAGSRVIYANTFGANRRKLEKIGRMVTEVVSAAVSIAREAAGDRAGVALDIGPLGTLLEPMGTLTFEAAWALFREIAEAGEKAGADIIVIETMTDLYEAKAALLAAKETTGLPVFVTMSFEESGRTFTGCTPLAMAKTLEGLGADALGFNCSVGPDKLEGMVRELAENTRLPLIVKPNAGLPDPIDGHYDMDPEIFAGASEACVRAGASIVGGCCGTSPEYIEAVQRRIGSLLPPRRKYSGISCLCTPTTPLRIQGIRIIGERINPTGKKSFQKALMEKDIQFILKTALAQEEAGADILDVNVGCPGVDEVIMLPRVVKAIQSVVSLPLQLDSSNPRALEAGLRVYNGKAAVNSVNGDERVLEALLPIVKKYGASVVGLCLDENGLPETAEGRIVIAEKILAAALRFGIPREDVWIDCLSLTASARQDQAFATLEALEYVHRKMELQTVLGVSNVSFGLPNRELINQSFLTQAMYAGLTLPIVNPNQKTVMDTVAAFRLLSGKDQECRAYVNRFSNVESKEFTDNQPVTGLTLEDAVFRGLKAEAAHLAAKALVCESPLGLVEERLIPALDQVGEAYDKGILFLPQLLSAAGAAEKVFEVVRSAIEATGESPVIKGTIVLATVKGDVHDIGKNIVKTVLENYGYEVVDLGRDVSPEAVVEAVSRNHVRLAGLSALMTTTLPAMEETARLLKQLPEAPKIMVGGAVVTKEYAETIGADFYAKDARASAEFAREFLG